MTTTPFAAVALTTRPGTANDNADSAAVFTASDGTVGAAVIDGIGHSPGTSDMSPVLAQTGARVAAQRGPLAGILSAAQLVSDPGISGDGPDAVGIAARCYPDGSTVVAWVGDCRAYGWDGNTLSQYGEDHSMREYLKQHGAPWEVAEDHAGWIRTSLALATVATVFETETDAPLVILTSDGVHDALEAEDLEELVRAHTDDPQALANALVAAPQLDGDGYRDDATAVVILRAQTNKG